MPPSLSVRMLDRRTVNRLLNLNECIDAVEQAFRAHAAGRALTPAMAHIDAQGGEFHVKCGGLREPLPYFACKVNGSFFQNSARTGLPNIIGLIVLSDASDGRPLAIMESGVITRLRTGAATAVAARYLARADSETVTICGAGLQGAIQLRALTRVLPIRRAFIWSRSLARAQALAKSASNELGVIAEAVSELPAATKQSDIIVTCTPSHEWFIGRDYVRPGTFISAVGADSPGKQELEPALVASSAVYCDLVEQCVRVGELQYLAKNLAEVNLRGTLGEVIAGGAPGRQTDSEITLFDSTGTALQDAAAAALVYERAVAGNLGSTHSLWD
jgi:ornithine cyclodeaminase/alanine dehydrogenase-like protein (mu-crystallin family)